MSGGNRLRKRRTRDPFVQVDSRVVRDGRLSFRARGLLVYLLDLPDGWDVRSQNLAAQTTEGREAVRSALRELAKHGHYRLERRQRRNGRWEMGTAVSEHPLAQWAQQSAEYGFKAVTVIEQPDGTYKVKRPDGTLTDDGFDPPPANQPDDNPGTVEDRGVPGGTEDGFPDAGFPDTAATGDGFSGAGAPGAGGPDSGLLGAFNKTETSYREVSEVPPASAPPRDPRQQAITDPAQGAAPTPATAPSDTPPAFQAHDHQVAPSADAPTGKARRPPPAPRSGRSGRAGTSKPRRERSGEEQARFELADDLATRWWARCEELGIPNIRKGNGPSTGFPGFRAMLERALRAGCTDTELKIALDALREPFPSLKALEHAIVRHRQHHGLIPPGHPGGTNRPLTVPTEAGADGGLGAVFG